MNERARRDEMERARRAEVERARRAEVERARRADQLDDEISRGTAGRTREPAARRFGLQFAAAAVLLAVGLATGLAIGTTNQASEPAPAEFAASLQGAELAPDASGQVTLTRTDGGWKIQLQGEGLPRRDDGAYYEAWLKKELKNGADILVPLGTFNQPDDITLWAGVEPSDYPTITVTRQSVERPRPHKSSGNVVLQGTIHPE